MSSLADTLELLMTVFVTKPKLTLSQLPLILTWKSNYGASFALPSHVIFF